MKHIRIGLALLATTLASGNVAADSFDFNLHSEVLRATYTMDLSERGYAGLSSEFGILYSQDEKKLDDILVHAGMHVSGENWSEAGSFDIRLGARVIHTAPGNTDLMAVPLGAQLRFSPIHRIGFGGHLYYAPKILSFLDAERYREFALRADYQLLPQAFVYVGYRYIDAAIENGTDKAKLEDNIHIGFKMLF
jgi:hypothetical protein